MCRWSWWTRRLGGWWGRGTKAPQVGQEGVGIGLNATLPNQEHRPAEGPQLGLVGSVPVNVAVKFLVPELYVGGGPALTFAASMPMPKTALDQHSRLITLQYQVGRSGQLADVEAVAKTGRPNFPADVPLRHRTPVSDPGHQCGAVFFGERVGHCFQSLVAYALALRIALYAF